MAESNIYELIEKIEDDVRALRFEIAAGFSAIAEKDRSILHQLAILLQSIEPPVPAAYLAFTWDQQEGTTNMPVTLAPGEVRGCTISPSNTQGGPSAATLSNPAYQVSDTTLLTVAPDPANPNTRFIATAAPSLPSGLTTDAATVTASATATEADGVTTEQVSGIDTVTINAATPPPPPPPLPAASLSFNWDPPAASSKRK